MYAYAARSNVSGMSATANEPTATPTRQRPWAWIAAAIVLLAVVAFLLVWGLGLQSDLDDQRAQTQKSQQETQAANEQVQQLSAEVDGVGQSVDAAIGKLQEAGASAQAN